MEDFNNTDRDLDSLKLSFKKIAENVLQEHEQREKMVEHATVRYSEDLKWEYRKYYSSMRLVINLYLYGYQFSGSFADDFVLQEGKNACQRMLLERAVNLMIFEPSILEKYKAGYKKKPAELIEEFNFWFYEPA